jgi:hypothetical protein
MIWSLIVHILRIDVSEDASYTLLKASFALEDRHKVSLALSH